MGWTGTAIFCATAASIAVVGTDVLLDAEPSPVAFLWNEFTRVSTLVATGVLITALRKRFTRMEVDHEGAFRRAVTDPLTGLYNRYYLHDYLRSVQAIAEREGRTYAILAIDVDGLKGLNDRLGHHAGDVALGAFAQQLRAALRQGELAFRVGGDEFLVLMPDASTTDAAALATRIVAVVADDAHARGPRVAGVSIGGAIWKPGATSADTLVRADAQMYASKRTGGSRFSLE